MDIVTVAAMPTGVETLDIVKVAAMPTGVDKHHTLSTLFSYGSVLFCFYMLTYREVGGGGR